MSMVPLTALWLPVLVSAVLVFVVSSVIHMLLPYHRSDYRAVPAEDAVMDALRAFKIPPGDYMLPCPGGAASMQSPEFIDKRKKGPVAIMTMMESGPPAMTGNLVAWFVYSIVIGLFSGYIASRAVPSGAGYLDVFRFVGTTAFMGYALGLWQLTIWYSRDWKTTLKSTFDGLIYALVTAGTFGWLWPR
jgi:hypothetical protein